MDFRTALKYLERLGEANFEEFAEATGIPRHNASVYLSRLFKMGLASRKRDRRYGKEYHRKPYLYQISEKKGNQYLKYEKTTKASLKRHHDEEYKRETKHLNLLRTRKEIRDLKQELAEPAPEPEKKIPYVTRDAVMLHLTSNEYLSWKKYEDERDEKERRLKLEEIKIEEERRRQYEKEKEPKKDDELVEWVIGEGEEARTIEVRPETVPMLIQAQNKKSGESEEIKILRDEIKEANEKMKQSIAQFQVSVFQKERKTKEDPVDRLFKSMEQLEKIAELNRTSDEEYRYAMESAKLDAFLKIARDKSQRMEKRVNTFLAIFVPLVKEYMKTMILQMRHQYSNVLFGGTNFSP